MKTVIKNAKIYTPRGIKHSVTIEDDKITGFDDSRQAGREIDARGKTVVAGFHDSHMHLLGIGRMLSILRVQEARSVEDLVRLGRQYIADNPDKDHIIGRGWNQDYFTDGPLIPTKDDLDRICADKPIVLTRACGHIGVANSKALEMAGVTGDTPDPGGGVFVRDARGEPNGVLHESALGYVQSIFPDISEKEIERRYRIAMDYVSALGITAVQANDLYEDNQEKVLGALGRLDRNGELKVRVFHQFTYEDEQALETFLKEQANSGLFSDRHRLSALKLFKDGSLGARTAWLRRPYHDDPATRGVETLPDEKMKALGLIAKQYGLPLVAHAIGDGAIAQTIDVMAAINDAGNPLRSGLIHHQITDPDLLKKTAQHHLHVFYQPVFLHYDLHIVADRVGKELAATSYAFKTQMDLGARTSYGTDAPIEEPNPLECLYCAVTRKDLAGNPPEGFAASEKVTVAEALANYSEASAYAVRMEDRLGRLDVGYYADLVILSDDPYEVEPDNIKDIRVLMTMMNGKVTFDRNGFTHP
ncbi:MAG: amidohydrolase [Christensenellales bacterium]|jgi:predicted amidohydrolase YtcJ